MARCGAGRMKPKAKPRLLDLFCGAGLGAKGYADAGFEVDGVDLYDQPSYPYGWAQEDALVYLEGNVDWLKTRYQYIHASPPCQSSSALTKGTNKGREYPQL